MWIGGDGSDDMLEMDEEAAGAFLGEAAAVALEVAEGVFLAQDQIERELEHRAVACEVERLDAKAARQLGRGAGLLGQKREGGLDEGRSVDGALAAEGVDQFV